MFARLITKILLIALAAGLLFFGVGLLGVALALELTRSLGEANAFALAGGVLLLAGLVMGLSLWLSVRRPKKAPAQAGGSELTKVLLAAVAKETPWIAIIGAGLAGAANMFLNRHKAPK